MLKKLFLLTVVVLSALSLPTQAFWQNNDITMLVMPREAIPLQIAQDISRRYPVMIVGYQLARGDLKIHAWNGDDWVAVSVEDYASGTFFANRPKHAIIVENEKFSAPAVLVPSSIWCESANRLSSTDPRTLIHLLGLSFDFPFRYWDQFAKRYGFSLEQINPTLNNVHWWNLPGSVLLEKRAQRNFSIDLDKWHPLETVPPSVVVPVVMEVEVPAAEPATPKKPEAGATAVDITAKAPEVPIQKTPAIKPTPVVEPVKVYVPAKAPEAPAVIKAPAVKPIPATETKPTAPAVEPVKAAAEPVPVVAKPAAPALPVTPAPAVAPFPSLKPEPVIVPAPLAEIEPLVETAPAAAPAALVEEDLFSTNEIPAAEVVVPQEPKKSWRNLF